MILTVRETATRRGRFDGFVDGKQVCWSSRTPFFSAARTLIKWGTDPSTVLTMVHERTGTRSLSGPIGQAAKLRVEDTTSTPRFRLNGAPEVAVLTEDSEKSECPSSVPLAR
jgi:hypothetical protein